MQNLKNQRKFEMQAKSSGVVIYAINSTFDYVSAARFAAKQVKKFLNLPVTLISNSHVEGFDSVIHIEDNNNSVRQYRLSDTEIIEINWFNQSRTLAYNLSPYDKTLLIDADYFMFNDSLKIIFDTDSEFACFNDVNDISSLTDTKFRLSTASIPMQWATVIYFTKCDLAKSIFDFMEIIKNNWEYYSSLYNFNSKKYRNDFSLSIALQALTGYSTHNFNKLPGKLHTIFPMVSIKSVNTTTGEIVHFYKNELSKLINTNIHCINKQALTQFYE